MAPILGLQGDGPSTPISKFSNELLASTGTTTSYQYDGLLRKTDVWHKTSGGSTMGRYQDEYDAASNVIERTDNDGSLTGFEYDGANQLEDETVTEPPASR